MGAIEARPLDSLVALIESDDLGTAASEALTTFVTLDRDDVRSRAWCLALYGVVESRFGHWNDALSALDEAASLADKAEDPGLSARIAIDRLVPVAHHLRQDLPEQVERAKSLAEGQPGLEATLAAILTRLPGSDVGTSARIMAHPTLQVVTENLPQQKSLALRGTVLTIGRRRSCDLQLQCDGELSRTHCRLELRADGWHVVDVSSRHTTRVCGAATNTGPLRKGTVLELGSVHLRVELV